MAHLVGRVGIEPTMFPVCLIYSQVPSPTRHTDPSKEQDLQSFFILTLHRDPRRTYIKCRLSDVLREESDESCLVHREGIEPSTRRLRVYRSSN